MGVASRGCRLIQYVPFSVPLSLNSYEALAGSNRDEVRERIGQGGWLVAYGVEINEGEEAKFFAAIAAAVAAENPAPINAYFGEYLSLTEQKIQSAAPELAAQVGPMVMQALNNRGALIKNGRLEVLGGLATYNEWQDIIVNEPHTGSHTEHTLFGDLTVPDVTLVPVNHRVPLPNKSQPYVKFRLVGSNPTIASPVAPALQRVLYSYHGSDGQGSINRAPNGVWVELRNNQTIAQFTESARTAEFVELYDSGRHLYLRLQADRMIALWPASNGWQLLAYGQWSQ